MAELEIQALAAGVGRDQDLRVLREGQLGLRSGIQVHAAVEQCDREATPFEIVRQHALCRHELGEDQHLEGWIGLLLLEPVDQLQQGLGLGVGAGGLCLARQVEQHRDLGLLARQPVQSLDGSLHSDIGLRLAVQLRPFRPLLRTGLTVEERRLGQRRVQCIKAPLQRRANRRRARRHQALHQDHQKSDMPLLGGHGLVVAMAHIVGHRLVETLLGGVPRLPGHRLEPRHARLEQRLPLGIDGLALLGADHERPHAIAGDAALVREGLPIQELDQAQEVVRLALVGRGGEQQQIGRRLGQRGAELVARHLLGAAAEAMGFVHDHQVPGRGDQVLEALPVVGRQPLQAPASSAFERLDRVDGADDLIVHQPEVVVALPSPGSVSRRSRRDEGAKRGELGRFDQPERLAEVQAHLRLPLAHQALRRHHQHAPHHPAQLQLPQDQPGLDGLAQADLVRQQVADALPGPSALFRACN